MNENNNNSLLQTPSLEGQSGIFIACDDDFAEILEIQKKAFHSEGILYQNFNIQPLTQTLEEMQEECKDKIVLKAVNDGKIVGSIRANAFKGVCWLNKLVVLPEYQRKGIGEKLLGKIETYFSNIGKYTLATGAKSISNIRLYEKGGYKIVSKENFSDGIEAVIMEKLLYSSMKT